MKFNLVDLWFLFCVWKVNLFGEGVDDVGGVFDDIIIEMC